MSDVHALPLDPNGGQNNWLQQWQRFKDRPMEGPPGFNGPNGSGLWGNPAPGTPNPATQTTDPSNLNALQLVKSLFPWIDQMGLTSQLQDWVAHSYTPDVIVAEIRKTPQWAQRFPGIKRPDGSLLMNEGQYVQTEDHYKAVLKDGGFGDLNFNDPNTYSAFFKQSVDPNELKTRVDTYNNVKDGGKYIQDAFYVYAGMNVNTDTLYSAVVDPSRAQNLVNEYNQKVAANPLDYQTWITRATEVGLANVANTLGNLQKQGLDTGKAITAIQQMDPNYARQMMDMLYHGGNPQGGDYLSLAALQRSFEYATIGSAATQSGLQLPTGDLLQQIRGAGVSHTEALKSFGDYAGVKDYLSGAAQRAGLGNFTQEDFEKAQFLHQGAAVNALNQIQSSEKELAKDSGAAAMQREQKTGLLEQPGYQMGGA